MSSKLRTSPRSTPQPAAAAQPRRQPRQKGGRFGKADGTASAKRKSPGTGCSQHKQRRDVKIVREALAANLQPPVVADIDSLAYEGEQLERRIAIKWRWMALGCPGPKHYYEMHEQAILKSTWFSTPLTALRGST
eukprot:COSAG05_NODE_5634_length_1125_cov_3.383041_1_plen_135_part_00